MRHGALKIQEWKMMDLKFYGFGDKPTARTALLVTHQQADLNTI